LVNIPKILETPKWKGKPLYREEILVLRTKHWKDYRK
jgi:hypothetical protein